MSDAGTPAISDPGEDIVALCCKNNIAVTSVPGCCAAINALTLSGLSTKRFAFEGFLPYQKKERTERLEEIRRNTQTLILYEAPHKLKNTLYDLFGQLGNRRIALCREMTKLNEEIIRTTLEDAVSLYEQKEPRGEYVLIIEGASDNYDIQPLPDVSIEEQVELYIKEGMSKMDAIKRTAKERKIPKNEVYNLMCK